MSDNNNIPQTLRELRRWVLWRYELRDGKRTKVPYMSIGTRADSTDADTTPAPTGTSG